MAKWPFISETKWHFISDKPVSAPDPSVNPRRPATSAWVQVWLLQSDDGKRARVFVQATPEAVEAATDPNRRGIVEESAQAISTQGRSAVDPYLDADELPAKLEIGTNGIIDLSVTVEE